MRSNPHADASRARGPGRPLAAAPRTALLVLALLACQAPVAGQPVVPALASQPAASSLSALIDDARAHLARGELQRAADLAALALETAERAHGSHSLEAARALLLRAAALVSQGQPAQALALQQRALAIREALLDPLDPLVAEAVREVGSALLGLGRYEESVSALQRALRISEAAPNPDHAGTAEVLELLGGALVRRGRPHEALPLLRRGLAISEKVLGADHVDTASKAEAAARVHSLLGQYQDALALNLRALAIREQVQGADHFDVAISANDLGTVYDWLGRHQEALDLKLRALAIHERITGPEHRHVASILGNVAYSHVMMGRRDLAVPLQLRALAIREKMQGPNHPDTAGSMLNLAANFNALAQPDRALPLQLRAQAIFERSYGPMHARTATGLINLARTHGRLGQHDKALPLLQRTLAINASSLGPEHESIAPSLVNLALTHLELGQPDQALPLVQRAMQIRKKTLGDAHAFTASTLRTLAQVQTALGEHALALASAEGALAGAERALGASHVDVAASLVELAAIRRALAQPALALPLLQRAEAIYQQAHGAEHPSTAAAQADLAALYLAQGDRPFAIMLLKQSVNALQAVRERVAGIGQEELRSYTGTVAPTFQRLAEALTDEGRLPEAQLVLDMLKEDEQFDFIRRSPGENPGRIRIGYNTVEQDWSTRYRQIAGQLAALGAEAQALAKAAAGRAGLTEAQRQRQRAVAADLAVAQAAFGSFVAGMRDEFARQGAARRFELAEASVQALQEMRALLRGLGDGAVLLQIYLTDDRVNLLLTTPGVQLARSTTVSVQALNRQVAQFRRQLRDPTSDPVPLAQALYQLLVAPVAQDLEQAGARTVMLSLDGALRYLPFGALHDGQGYLLRRWALPVYTSVTRARLLDAVARDWQAAGLGLTRQHGAFEPLPGVLAEMRGVIRTGPAGTPGAGGALPGEVYLDEAFTAQRFKDVSQRRFPVLHVASHFRFSPGTEANSFLLLGDGQQLTLGEMRAQNYRFDQVDLLTLSACDTALGGGRDERGREIEGFGVIAQQQGARAVLASLWPVADQSTAGLMADTYRRRQERQLSKIEALRQAQLALQAQGRHGHPFYWAPFILMGNWL